MRKNKLRLGVFLAPFHGLRENPTLCFERDLEFTQYADEIGLGEFWFGEHHTGGYEMISSPELMIAAAAQRTKRIKLGTGVISLPYHNPFNVAQRIAQLDHLTRGRLMFGAGPGLLTADAYVRGLDARESRDKTDQALSVITRLLRGEWVTEKTGWYDLREAHCHILPCSEPLEVCVASAMSPNGGVLAAKYHGGMLCLAATLYGGFDALSANWTVARETAVKYGYEMNPTSVRLATDMHIAETREMALAQVQEGYELFRKYFFNQSGHLKEGPAHDRIEDLIERGEAIIGTPDDAIAQIRRLEEKLPNFGCLLLFDKNWARMEHKKNSLELMMRYVLPEINGDNVNRVKSFDWQTSKREEFFGVMMDSTQRAFDKHEADKRREKG